MTTLRESLQQHRTAELAAACVMSEERQSALVVSGWQSDSWVLPWSHFVSARHGGDRIEITFANVVVILTGKNLAPLLDDIATFRLSRLRELPADYRRKPAEGQPFVTRIEVRPATAPIRETPG